jgi:hypothetical protein
MEYEGVTSRKRSGREGAKPRKRKQFLTQTARSTKPQPLTSIGYENLGSYQFNTKTKSHKFCKSCGSSILIDFRRTEQGEPDPAKDILAVNVRHARVSFI